MPAAFSSRPVLIASVLTSVVAMGAFASPRIVPGEVLVHPVAGLPAHALERIATQAGGRMGEQVRGTRLRVVKVPPGQEQAVAERLTRNPRLRFAEPNWLLPPSVVPNDPMYVNGWHLPKLGLPAAWTTSLANDVVIAVLDTGVTTSHADLSSRLLSGWNVESQNADVTDTYGHGTMVSGIAAGATNNAVGIAGTGWGARLLPVKTTNASDGWASNSNIAAGIAWAASRGAKVVNISYDIVGSSTIENAAQQFRAQGGIVVGASGNSGSLRSNAAQAGIVFVGATDSSDNRASFSSYGNYVDLAAPGVSISTTAKGGGYTGFSGTSAAAPVVSGIVALMRAANPGLGASQIESILATTAVDRGTAGYDTQYGWGRIDAAAAVAAANAASVTDTTAPSVSFTAPANGATVSGLQTVAVSASDNVAVTRVELRVNGTVLATETVAPWQFVWDTASSPNGAVNLDVYAFDGAGNSRTARSTVTVANQTSSGSGADTTAPSLRFTSPANGATVNGTVGITATATDNVAVSMVSVSVDGRLLCSGTPTASCSWNTRKATTGTHAITATALDAAGNRANASMSVTVTASSGRK